MSLAPGARLGAYQVLSLIGAGGMGEVYRARDRTLDRHVAIKVLPESFATDPERLARFEREAKTIAALNHPHIAHIYGFEQADNGHALVMELVEGEDLAQQIARGPIPLDEALLIARQIAEALEAAHEQGIVHRDLKPANVKVRPDGTVKVLDFGLAKAMEPAAGSLPSLTQSPTITSPALMTGVGVILGTAAYMAPEQAKGKAADARSDIWAFGVILYEMLAGKSVFGGETMMEVLGGVLKSDPEWNALPAATPPAVRKLLRRCLQKDRNRRLHHIADARIEIEEALNEPAGSAAAVAPARTSHGRLMWMAATLGGVIAASVMSALYFRSASVEAPEIRLQINTPTGDPTWLAISPDGRHVVFQANAARDRDAQLWLRPLASETAQPIAGTEGGAYPFWSPDSRSIGFFADQKLKRIDIVGGTAQTLSDAPGGNSLYGGTWNADGTVLFVPANTAPIYRVPAGGGQPAEVTRVESPRQVSHRFPHFLPDGRHFLFLATGAPEAQGVYLGSLDSKETRRLIDADTAAVFAPPDFLLFVRQETLFAQRLDLGTLEPTGEPFPVAERVAQNQGIFGSVALSASAAGPLAYRAAVPQPRQLIWFDRSGKQIGTVGEPDTAEPGGARLSPDGRTLALSRRVSGNTDLWLIETSRGVLRRFTFNAANDAAPTWSPDGSRIAFHSSRKGGGGFYDLYQKAVAGAGAEEVLFESSENKNIMDWSLDSRFILYANASPKTARDLWALPLDGDRKPFVVVQTLFEESNGRFSPDGRWIAYLSNESGRNEVYAQPFPGPGRNWRISTGGSGAPKWRSDGREIFYIAPDNRLMAVPVTLNVNGPTVEAGAPVALFTTRSGSQFAASPDGQRFLINTPLEDAATPPITVVLNWKPRP